MHTKKKNGVQLKKHRRFQKNWRLRHRTPLRVCPIIRIFTYGTEEVLLDYCLETRHLCPERRHQGSLCACLRNGVVSEADAAADGHTGWCCRTSCHTSRRNKPNVILNLRAEKTTMCTIIVDLLESVLGVRSDSVWTVTYWYVM